MNSLKQDISDALKRCILYPGEGHILKIMPYKLIEKGYQLLANVSAPNDKGGQDQVIVISHEGKAQRYLHFAFRKYSRYKGKPIQKREFFIGLPTEITPRPRDIILLVNRSVLHTRTEIEGGGMLRYRGGRIELFDDPYCNRYGTFEYARIGIVDKIVDKVLRSCGIESIVLEDQPL